MNATQAARRFQLVEWAVSGLLIAYAVVLAAESFVAHGSEVYRNLMFIETVIATILIVEVMVRGVYASWRALAVFKIEGENELRSAWFWFDVVATGLAFLPGFEAFRGLRLLRLIGRFEFFRHPVELLLRALAHSIPLAALALFLVSVNALIANRAYGSDMAEFARFDTAVFSSLFLVFFDDMGTRYLEMYQHHPLAMITHLVLALVVGVLVVALFVSTVLEVRDELKAEREEEERKHTS
ncbi:MAG TPA: ion transporter [Candidatus Paceibacterota bacterium]|nr:ion transporter [Candidatus Paceibacterota bacterium]